MSEELAFKAPVRLATTANITLSGEQTIDGAATSEDRVLVKNQSAPEENGIYVSSSGPWARASDFDGPGDFATGTMVRVNEGAVNAGEVFGCTVADTPPNIGTSSITWAVFTPSTELPGDLAAIEALTGTGIARRTGSETWSLGTLVGNAELDDMAQATIKGRAAGAGTGDATDLTGTQATAILDAFAGDSGAGGVKGLVPAPAMGDAEKFLKGDGSWDAIVVSNAELDDMPEATIKGRAAGEGTGDPDDLTGTEATAILDAFVGDSGSGGTKGLVPAPAAGDADKFLRGDGTFAHPVESIIVCVTEENAPVTTGTAKIKFRMPYAFTLTAVRASLSVTQSTSGSGGVVTVDINESGATVLSTKLTIDNAETTSTTAAAPAVISDAALDDDAEITIDVDTVGDGTARGLKVALIGVRT